MRVLFVILAVAATPAAAAVFWVRSNPVPPSPPLRPHSIVWADRVFTNPKALRRWLHVRDQRYAVWARKHPSQAALLEHRRLPKKQAPAGTAAKAAGRDGSAETALAFLAALLALTGTVAVAQRVRRRTRLRRPRISFPTIRVDVRPVADSVGHALARLAQIRMPERRSAPARSAPLERGVAGAPPAPMRNGRHPIVLEPHPVLEATPSVETLPPVEPDVREAPPAAVRNGRKPIVVEPPPVLEAATPETVPPVEAHPPIVKPLSPVEAPAPPIVPSALPEIAVPDREWELCTAACWRGYTTARFYAHPPRRDTSIAHSTPVDWWAWQDAPRNPDAAQAAFADLCSRLQAAGWEALGRGVDWYEIRFRRRPQIEW